MSDYNSKRLYKLPHGERLVNTWPDIMNPENVMNFNLTHPELRGDEVFLTNTSDTSMQNIGRKGKRLGSTAYDIHGKPVKGLWPVFCAPNAALDSHTSKST